MPDRNALRGWRISIDHAQLTPSAMLARRLLWNRAVDESSRPQPVVVLLGPTGSGKSEALRSISHDCGSGVVHNPPFDFHRTAPVTTVEALAQVAFDLSRRWPARKTPRFTRFALGLIAVQTQLGTLNRDHARESLRTALREFARNPLADRVADQVEPVTDAAGPYLDPAIAGTVKLVLPRLIQAVGRRRLANAKRWHADIPEAEGASPVDALIHLNQRAQVEPADVTAWLTSAFLADLRDNHTAMAVPDPHSPCSCDNPGRTPHLHNWFLLLDNIDHEGGSRFLADITNARERHLRQHDEHDALVIVATSGRWNPIWETDWYAPWKSAAGKPDQVRIVPRNRDADYQYWAGNSDIEHPRPDYYPVLLEPLNVEETARILGTSPYARESVLAQRASGGLPRAVQTLAPLLSSGEIQPGKRDTLWPTEPDATGEDLWRSRLEDLRLAEHLPDVDIEEFVAAAPFATAPWLVPAEATSLVSQPQAGRILTELRTALWVIAPTRDRGTEDSVELHPWIARTLLTSLANWTSPELPSYRTQFEALLNDPDTKRDQARRAYCQLALGRIGDVVSTFEYNFDLGPHQDWIDQLALVTNAPDDRPLHLDLVDIFHDLVDADLREVPRDRTPVRNILTRLLVADWLVANPFATPDPERKTIIVNAFSELAPLSRRPDVAALYEAAERASKIF